MLACATTSRRAIRHGDSLATSRALPMSPTNLQQVLRIEGYKGKRAQGITYERRNSACRHSWRRALDQQRRQCEAVHARKMQCRSEQRGRRDFVRAWLIHGVAADL